MIDRPAEVRGVLEQLAAERVKLTRALNMRTVPEIAVIELLRDSEMLISTQNFERQRNGSTWRLSGFLGDASYFFFVSVLQHDPKGRATVSVPRLVYKAERRERIRAPGGYDSGPTRVLITAPLGLDGEGEVEDFSAVGLALRVRTDSTASRGSSASIEFLDGKRAGVKENAQVRSVVSLAERPGWKRIGLSLLGTADPQALVVDRRRSVVGTRRLGRVATRMAVVASAIRAGSLGVTDRRRSSGPEIRTVQYTNSNDEQLVGILDTSGDPRGAPVVVIPPAWGKTKETLLPLASTIVATFKRSGLPISVLRFDGIRRRGESFNDPGCRAPGREYLRFTFSQGVRDIQATLDFLFGDSGLDPSMAILVSFSAASIDARRAVALEQGDRLGGWVNVVGAPDLQSAMRVVSGGIDYVGGCERGFKFGLQEIQGVTVDMDHAASDALQSRLAFLDDALRDMEEIRKPITWIHGRFDAWMDFERVKMLMGTGDCSRRRLIEVPTGHQLRSSVEALEVFQLIAAEVGSFAGAKHIARAVPNPIELRNRVNAERRRLPQVKFESRRFWRDYLVGREGNLGIELMTATSAYKSLMARQVVGLCLESGHRIVDLGSGVGSFTEYLTQCTSDRSVRVTEVDLVPEALKRSRTKLEARREADRALLSSVVANLEVNGRTAVPLADASQDSALASLLVSYLPEPGAFLREVRRVLKPGGRLVLSTLRPDADTSRIYEDGAIELRTGRALVDARGRDFDLGESLRSFLNDAARLLDLEEQRVFRFFEESELRSLVEESGFEVLDVDRAFGSPPQALVLTARKPPV